MLEVHVSISVGQINPSTDFLYLVPQLDMSLSGDPHAALKPKSSSVGANLGGNGLGSTTATTTNTSQNQLQSEDHISIPRQNHVIQGSGNTLNNPNGINNNGGGGPEDKEPLPLRLRDVKKDRVIMI